MSGRLYKTQPAFYFIYQKRLQMNKFFIFALVLLGFGSCANNETSTTEGTATESVELTPVEKAIEEAKEAEKREVTLSNIGETIAENSPIIGKPGSAISTQTSELIDALAVDIWEIAAYLRMALPVEERLALNEKNQGRWFTIAKDGTFKTGKFEEETGKGKWYYDPMGPSLYFDHDTDQDEEYTIKMNSERTVMIWIGTKRFDASGIQAKVENSSDFPKRK